MWKSILKVMAATVVFGLVHSALASQKAKTSAVRLVGERRRNAWYRPVCLVQSLVTFGSLAVYVKGLPNRTLYSVRGPLAGVMQLTRVASVGYAVYAAHLVGIPAMLGWPGLTAWWHGTAVVPREPETQGPARAGGEGLHVAGPFLVSRHPLNLAPLPVLWLDFGCAKGPALIAQQAQDRRAATNASNAREAEDNAGVLSTTS